MPPATWDVRGTHAPGAALRLGTAPRPQRPVQEQEEPSLVGGGGHRCPDQRSGQSRLRGRVPELIQTPLGMPAACPLPRCPCRLSSFLWGQKTCFFVFVILKDLIHFRMRCHGLLVDIFIHTSFSVSITI